MSVRQQTGEIYGAQKCILAYDALRCGPVELFMALVHYCWTVLTCRCAPPCSYGKWLSVSEVRHRYPGIAQAPKAFCATKLMPALVATKMVARLNLQMPWPQLHVVLQHGISSFSEHCAHKPRY